MKALKIAGIGMIFIALAFTSQQTAAHSTGQDSTVVTTLNNEKLFDRFEESLLHGLSSDVTGVQESALFNAVNFKIEYPEFTSEKVEEKLNKMTVQGDNHSLKYKAFLVLTYYKNTEQFDSPDTLLSLLDYTYQDGIFFFLQEKVQSDQLTSN
jgi:hypothetical protein